ncbi:hypothetical protein LZ554_008047 [Drepanopeziza brunnea f. sp. 'monogermtubi']|nr:hypothetical protein LZ554_008047 [Drepanopeziza brunnea f. sp. 'monogermtubi']
MFPRYTTLDDHSWPAHQVEGLVHTRAGTSPDSYTYGERPSPVREQPSYGSQDWLPRENLPPLLHRLRTTFGLSPSPAFTGSSPTSDDPTLPVFVEQEPFNSSRASLREDLLFCSDECNDLIDLSLPADSPAPTDRAVRIPEKKRSGKAPQRRPSPGNGRGKEKANGKDLTHDPNQELYDLRDEVNRLKAKCIRSSNRNSLLRNEAAKYRNPYLPALERQRHLEAWKAFEATYYEKHFNSSPPAPQVRKTRAKKNAAGEPSPPESLDWDPDPDRDEDGDGDGDMDLDEDMDLLAALDRSDGV